MPTRLGGPVSKSEEPSLTEVGLRVSEGKKAFIIIFLAVASGLVALVVWAILVMPATLFADNVKGEERTDAEMIAYFHEHNAEFAQLVDSYGLPAEGQVGELEPVGAAKKLGLSNVSWNAPISVVNLHDGVDGDLLRAAKGLWLYVWETHGFQYGETKGYVYTKDPLGPLTDDLDRLSLGHNPDVTTGLCFREIGDGWYLFHTLRSGG
jgi:hypothetical protein